MVKQIFSFLFDSRWCIGKLEIRERQARLVNNQASNMNPKVTFPNIFCLRYKIVKLDSKFKSNVG
jgi:lipocalin